MNEKNASKSAFQRALERCNQAPIGGVVDTGSRAGFGAVLAQELAAERLASQAQAVKSPAPASL